MLDPLDSCRSGTVATFDADEHRIIADSRLDDDIHFACGARHAVAQLT
jgi:hypothetical protein